MNYLHPCASCSCRYPVIPGDGPLTSHLLFVGERPGRNENSKGRPFIGDAGMEFNSHLLPLAGLERDDIRIMNAVKCWAEKNRKPTGQEVSDCASKYLVHEIEEQDPEVIVLMGGTACSLIPDIDLERDHGIPQTAKLFGQSHTIFPTYHPALGLHDTSKIRHLRDDFKALGRYLDEGGSGLVDLWAGREQYRLSAPGARARSDNYGADTETVRGKLWSVQFSTVPGEGIFYLANDRAHMEEVNTILVTGREFYFHNAIHDIELLYKSGFNIPLERVTDTMAMAYHRGLPQKLKVLAYRLCGMKMQSYEDLVLPYSTDVVMEWAVEAMTWLATDHPNVEGKKNPAITELKRIAGKLAEGGDYDPWKRREKILAGEAKAGVKEWLERVEERLGPMPVAGLDQVPLDRVVWYGSRDADAGLRVKAALDRYQIANRQSG